LKLLKVIQSGERRQKGWDADIERAAKRNFCNIVPSMRQGRLEPFRP
jgi:hypothetical protein